MRKVYRTKRREIGVWTGVAAIFGVAICGNLAATNASEGATANGATSRWETETRGDGANGGFWPRLGSGTISTTGFGENFGEGNVPSGGVGNAETAANAAVSGGCVETADFVGYSVNSNFAEQKKAVSGRTRLVDWSTLDAAEQPENAAVLEGSQTLDPVSAPAPPAPDERLSEDGKNGETTEDVESKEDSKNSEVGVDEAVPSRSKTPIVRDESASSPRNGGGWGSALVSTFGALAVVLGAFFALVAFLKRTSPKSGGEGALAIVDSLAVGDKARLLTIRWGNRLILAAKTPEKIAPLAEITDPDEASAMLEEIERRKKTAANGDVGAKAAAIWKRGCDAASACRTSFGAKGRRQ